MDINDLHPPEDHGNAFFIWHEFLNAAGGVLTAENVFHYFAYSMFYERESTNQILHMQTKGNGYPETEEAEQLRRFKGVEFAVVHSQPPFFIIQKRERLSPDEVRPLAAYFVTNNRIYQAPDVYSLLSNRLLATVNSLQSSLDILRKNRPEYTPRTGFVWPITDPTLAEQTHKKGSETESNTVGATGDSEVSPDKPVEMPKRQQNNMLLLNAMRTTAAHSKMSFSASSVAVAVESEPETPVTATIRSSATPAPASQDPTALQRSMSQEVTKNQAGKKKKKRTSVAPPA